MAVILTNRFHKTPNIGNKTAVPVTSVNTLRSTLALFGSRFQTSTHFITITGDLGGAATTGFDIPIPKGGTQANPLVITTPGAGNDVWTTRKRVYNSSFVVTAPWVWLFGLWMQMLPVRAGAWNTNGATSCVTVRASNLFVTACRMSASQGVWHKASDVAIDRPTVCHNWYEIASQAQAATGSDVADFGFRSEDAGAAVLATTMTNLTHGRNRFSDHPASLGQSTNFRAVIIGNGHNGAGLLACPGTQIAWDFIDASCSHPIETKRSVDAIHHIHVTGRGKPFGGLNTRGENVSGPIGGVRPLMNACRVDCQQWQVNGNNWDYANCWVVNTAGALSGDLNVFPNGVDPADADIAGGDGCRFVGCKANMVLGFSQFEPTKYTYGNLGDIAPVVIAAHVGGTFTDNAGAVVGWTGGTTGTATGNHLHLTEARVSRQAAVPAGLALETPPVLSAALCGPAAAGRIWAGAY